MKTLSYVPLAFLIGCSTSSSPIPTQPTPVEVVTPAPEPVVDEVFTRINKMFECELKYRKDTISEYRYWLYTEGCNHYYMLKWFPSIESKSSLSYIGLVGYEESVYVDTKSNSPSLYIKAMKAGGDQFDDSKNEYVTVFKVNLTKLKE